MIPSFMDLEIDKDQAYNSVAFQFYSFIATTRLFLKLDDKDVVRVINAASTKLIENGNILNGMRLEMDELFDNTIFAKSAQIIRAAHESVLAVIKKEKEGKQDMLLGKRYQKSSENLCFCMSVMTPTQKTRVSAPKVIRIQTSEDCEEDLNVIRLAHINLKKYPKKEYFKQLGHIVDDYIELDTKELVLLDKHHCVSCSIHDRLHPSKIIQLCHFARPTKIISMYNYLFKDMFPKENMPLSSLLIDTINQTLTDFRDVSHIDALRKAGVSFKAGNLNHYVASDETTYFRDGRNGRPDLVLYDKKKRIVGIIVVKHAKSLKQTTNWTNYMKQAAHYGILFKAVETFLALVARNPIGAKVKIIDITTEAKEVAASQLDTMLMNIYNLNKTINAAASK